MNLGDLLDKPLVIDGQEVILVDDQIGDAGFDPVEHEVIEIEPPDGVSPGFYINEETLMAIRTQYPDHTPYGLWQTLYHSGYLSGSDFLFLPYDEVSGRYAHLLQSDDGWEPLSSGIVIGGSLGDGLTDVDVAHKLDVDPSLLVIPQSPALLTRERLAMIEQRSRKRYWRTGAVCFVLIMLGALFEGAMMIKHSSQVSTIEDLRSQQRSLDERMGSLTRSRLLNDPSYSQSLQRIFELHTIDPNAATANNSSFANDVILVLGRDTLPLVKSIDWIVPEVTDDGSVAVIIDGRGKG